MDQINSSLNPPILPEIPVDQSSTPSSSNKHVLIILLIVFIVILFSLLIYIFVKLQTPSQIPVVSPTLIIQTTPTPDPTANWKTYINQDYKFLIKYPNDWTPYTCIRNETQKENNEVSCENNVFTLMQNDLLFIEFTSTDGSFKLLVSKDLPIFSPSSSSNENNTSSMAGATSNIVNLPDVNIGGVISKKTSATGPASVTTFITTRNNNLIYNFSMSEIYWDKNAGQKINKIYEKILASFKFL